MGAGVETRMEIASSKPGPAVAAIRVRMLGQLAVARDGQALELPASRKVRALFAYLALAPRPVEPEPEPEPEPLALSAEQIVTEVEEEDEPSRPLSFDEILGGTNSGTDGAFYLIVTPTGGGSDVALIVNNG